MPMDYGEKKKIVDKLGGNPGDDDSDGDGEGKAAAGTALEKALKSGEGKAIFRAVEDIYAMCKR